MCEEELIIIEDDEEQELVIIEEDEEQELATIEEAEELVYPKLQEKTIIPNKATQEITSDKGIYGLSKVIVEKIPDEYIIPSETKDITENGIHNVRLYENANVNVKPKLQEKTIVPSKESQEVIPDDSFYGLNKVTVNPIGDEYIIPTGKLDITENGEYDVTEYANVNVDIETGQVIKEVEWKDVVFIDFDGTPLYSYTMEEVQELTELPPLPTREGFTYQGWNWTLSDIKKQNDGAIVGAHCVTSDGLTRIYVEVDEYTRSFIFGISQNVANGFLIDWGDGTSDLSGSKTGSTTPIDIKHTYQKSGKYVITLIPQSDTAMLYIAGTSSNASYLINHPNNATSWTTNNGYLSVIKKIEVGNRLDTIGQYGLYYCIGLETINIPIDLTVGNAAFRNNSSLKSIVIPSGVTTMSTYCFYKCCLMESISLPSSFRTFANYLFGYCDGLKHLRATNVYNSLGNYCFSENENLRRFKINDGITSIPTNAFDNCFNLQTMDDIPSSVKTISSGSFRQCFSLKKLVFKGSITSIGANAFYQSGSIDLFDFRNCTSVPTLSATSAFMNMSQYAQIVVPDNLYDEWIVKTNWSTYDNYIVKESEYNA